MSAEHWDLDQDNTLGGNSPSPNKVSSQKALKEYIDSQSGGSTVDQEFDASSENAQSGIAIAGELDKYPEKAQNENITGVYNFVGQKRITFSQSSASDKLGFTCFNASNTELGAFEWKPSTIGVGALLNVNVPYSSSNYVGFRYWGTAVNVIAPKVATAGNYYIPTHITDGTNTVTATNTGVVNISTLLSEKQNKISIIYGV